MKILKELNNAKLVIVDLEVRLGEKLRSAPTTAHDGRPILMKEENSIED